MGTVSEVSVLTRSTLFCTCTTASPGEVTLKLVALVAVPPGVVTLIVPLVAPLGTVAVT